MEAIGRLKQFLMRFVEGLEPLEGGEDLLKRRWMSRKDEGSIFLDLQDQQELGQVVQALHKQFGGGDQISLREIERRTQDAMFAVADLQGRRSGELSQRVSEAVKELREALERAPQTFRLWVPVRGVKPDDLPADFADGRFCLLDDDVEKRILDLARRHLEEGEDSAPGWERLLKDAKQAKGVWGLPVVEVEVEAVDLQAAEDLAQKRVIEYIDVLNYFSDLVPYHYGNIYHPGWLASEAAGGLAVSDDGLLTTPITRVGPLSWFSFSELRKSQDLKEAVGRAEELLSKGTGRTRFENIILTAMAWAGRATIARSLEEEFLLFAIALESIILPGKTRDELQYRTALRTAFLLASSGESRAKLMAEVKRLYKIRSDVVHNGNRRITKKNVRDMRSLAKSAVYRVLLSEDLNACEAPEDAEAWFEAQVTG